jgi:hypothetical protein
MSNSKKPDDTYKIVPFHAIELAPCGFCYSPVNMWQYTNALDVVTFAVMCSLSQEEAPSGDDCPLFMPPDTFYHDRKIEAAEYWNKWATFGNSRRNTAEDLDDHSELMKKLPRVSPDLLEELKPLSPWALRKRVLIQSDWIRSYSSSLDGLDLNVGIEKCRDPRDIRRIVESVIADARRFEWCVKYAGWIRDDERTYFAVPVALNADLSCVATRRDAIDKAIKETTS